MSLSNLSTIIFDLDDTLLDTYYQITGQALPQSCAEMIQQGLKATLKDCLRFRRKYISSRLRTDFFESLAYQFSPVDQALKISNIGQRAYTKKVQEIEFSISPSTYSLLTELRLRYDLFLVTAGTEERQQTKVKKLKLEKFFEDIFYVDLKKGATKKRAFSTILQTIRVEPQKCLAVGNRLDLEIADANSLGINTCLILTGEYRRLTPRSELEAPDYTIGNLDELRQICRS